MIERYLAGRAAMVTGGASGQGRAIALALAEHGADVAIGSFLATHGPAAADEDTYLPPRGDLDAVCHEIMARGAGAVGCDLDVRRADSVEAFHAAAINAFGKVDILVNAAGVCAEQPICGHAEALWLDIIDTNLSGYFRTTRACLPGMIERRWGRIVSLSSVAGLGGTGRSVAYATAKAALIGFTKSLAREVAPHGITVNAVAPGFIATPMTSTWPADRRARVAEETPVRREGTPEDIAHAIAYLASEEASFVTGQILSPNGGRYM